MRIPVEQRHIDTAMRQCGSACVLALAIKDELDKLPIPKGYLRVERVVSVSSSVLVTEHRIIKRKGREEVDLAFEKYWLGSPSLNDKGDEVVNLHARELDYMVAFDEGHPVSPTEIEIVRAKE